MNRSERQKTGSLYTNSTRSSVININDLPLPTDDSETATFQGAIFIEDGIRYRSIHHKIDPTSLKIYRIYYSRYIRFLLGLVIFVDLLLAFFEYPTSISLSSDMQIRNRTWELPDAPCITESIDLLCLLVFMIDCILKFLLIGWRRFIRKPWLVLYLIMIVISFIDIGISLSFCNNFRDKPFPERLVYTLRIRRYCRPLFFLLSSTIMKKFAKAVVLTLPQIFSVLVLLVIHLYIFAMIGLLVFPPSPTFYNGTALVIRNDTNTANTYSYYSELEGDTYFSSVSESFTSLLVLLTTANHPDVMMPIYQYNRFSSIYFILFLGIGTFLILNLLIAATYNQFKGFFLKSLQTSLFRRRVAYRAAFTLLMRRTKQIHQKNNSKVTYVQDVVSRDLIRRLFHKVRLPKKQIPQMYSKLENMQSDTLNWKQFCEVFDLVSKEPSNRNHERLPFYGRYRWFQWIQFAIRHRFFSYTTYFLSVVNVILITVELQISYYGALRRTDSRLAYYNLVFVVYYIFEQILKLIGYGIRGYFRNIGNIYEGGVTLLLVILETLVFVFSKEAQRMETDFNTVFHRYDTVIRIMNILIIFRLLRIVAHVKSLRILISIVMDLFKNLSGFAGLMVIIYYIFALLGMELFLDVDGPSSTKTPDGKDWGDKCGTYDNLHYYANNFHDFASSIVTLWDVMVVNNWFVFLDKFARDSMLGGWSKLYFIAWWLLAAIIGMNLFVSLLLDTFLLKWEAVHRIPGEDDGIFDDNLDRFANSSDWEATTNFGDRQVKNNGGGWIYSGIPLNRPLLEPVKVSLLEGWPHFRDRGVPLCVWCLTMQGREGS